MASTMRLSTVFCNISITIYGLSPNSCPLISLVHRTGMVKSIYSMADKAQYSFLTDAVVVIWSDVKHGPRFSNCRLPASTWVEAINKMNLVGASLGVDVRSSMQPAMSRSPSCLEKPTTNLTEQINTTSQKLDGAVSFSRYFDHRLSVRLRKFGVDASGKPLMVCCPQNRFHHHSQQASTQREYCCWHFRFFHRPHHLECCQRSKLLTLPGYKRWIPLNGDLTCRLNLRSECSVRCIAVRGCCCDCINSSIWLLLMELDRADREDLPHYQSLSHLVAWLPQGHERSKASEGWGCRFDELHT